MQKEEWRWEVIYKDNTKLEQFEGEEFHSFSEIDQDNLNIFRMVHDTARPFVMLFPEKAKLIHFYRNIVLENGSVHIRLYVFWYELKGVKVLNVIMPNGDLVITDDIEKVRVS